MHSNYRLFFGAVVVSGIGACASVAPTELVDARAAYQRASQGPAAQLAPADLHKAKSALGQAERAFKEQPEDQATRDLSYVALRKSELAVVMAQRSAENKRKSDAEQDLQKAQTQQLLTTSGALTQARSDLALSRQTTDEANARTKAMEERLAKLAGVKQDTRGTIVTLSGSVLFGSNQSSLLPTAETRLSEVSTALLDTKERNIRVEGYTDSRGSDEVNLALSLRRAEAVRTYLVSHGYESDLVQAHGMGKSDPIASNLDAEGRANNRRVEIVVEPAR